MSLRFNFLLTAFVLAACTTLSPIPAATVEIPAATAAAIPATPTLTVPTATPAPTNTATAEPTATSEPTATPVPDEVLLAAGDIASCVSYGAEATAKLIDAQPGRVLTLGDNAYEDGSADQFAQCYDPTWGRFKDRTLPSLGNHDYVTRGASAYFDYFGVQAGERGQGYYSFDLGAWHLIALNSNCTAVSCAAGSAQEQWLQADLAGHSTACTLAYWHHPLFNAGLHGPAPQMEPIWQALYEGGADVVLNGHDHNYQRFAPQDPQGNADAAQGIREFVVGTGGASHYPIFGGLPNLEAENSSTFGVLKLVLHPTSYDWAFLPEAGKTFSDSGTGECH